MVGDNENGGWGTRTCAHRSDFVSEQWAPGANGQESRKFQYLMDLNNNTGIGPKTTTVYLSQRITRDESNRALVVEHQSETPHVPYGDAFRVLMRYALVAIDARRTRMVSSYTIEFSRSFFLRCACRREARGGRGTMGGPRLTWTRARGSVVHVPRGGGGRAAPSATGSVH